jgi:hypothetical protein
MKVIRRNELFWLMFEYIWKVNIRFEKFVCKFICRLVMLENLYVWKYKLGMKWKDFWENWYWGIVWKYVKKRKIG